MMNCGLGARVSNDASDGAVDGMYVENDAALPLELAVVRTVRLTLRLS